MKTIFTLFASLLLSASLLAADFMPKSMLTVQSAGNEDIRVVVDGRRFETDANRIVIYDLGTGRHSIKIYRERRNGFFSILGSRYELVYNTSIQVKNRSHIQVSIDRNGRASMVESRLIANGRNSNMGNDRYFDFEKDGRRGDYDYNDTYARAMNDREFKAVLQAIDKEWLESNKLKSALQIVRNNNLSSAQVKEMLLLFSFENNKLELAKQAYANTVDKRNYTMVYDVFSFSSSKTELDRFIRGGRF
ncbi:MAG TPA: DUF4476 domain-containing protein [Chitinophagaceae bacterium]|nr:DUF4476 domain-containing protein [Chitinophagaceae bacterium]